MIVLFIQFHHTFKGGRKFHIISTLDALGFDQQEFELAAVRKGLSIGFQ